MRKKIVLITGAGGEVGQALIKELSNAKTHQLVTLDLSPLPVDIRIHPRETNVFDK